MIVGILFSSCRFERAHRTIYASQAANINYFKQKGDSKITGYYSGDGNAKNDGFNIQTGYALSNHLAIMAAYTNKQEYREYRYDSIRFHRQFFNSIVQTNIFDSSVIHYRRNTFEIGVGYFFPLDHKKTVTYNLYSGVSFGKFFIDDAGLDSNNNKYSRFYDAKSARYFIQGNFNFMPYDFFHVSTGGKFSFLNFRSINTSYEGSELYYFYLDKIDNKTFFLWEPFFNIQITPPKYSWIKIDGQLSFTSKLDYEYPKVRTFNGSFGLTIEINKLLKRKKD
jgi:hypothetical protein